MKFTNAYVLIFLALISPFRMWAQKSSAPTDITTVIYSTDLWTPPGDPDDQFDLLTLLSVKNIQLDLCIIDNTMQANFERTKILKVPNCRAVQKAGEIFGNKNIACATGLLDPLKTKEDKGIDQKKEYQQGVERILSKLKKSEDQSVVIITTGSLRDIAAAFNRNQNLFRKKVKRLIISVGDSYGVVKTDDTNTAKDVEAWKRIMMSGLPIDWMPTNPSKHRGGPSRYCSYWYFIQSELLQQSPEEIKAFFKSEGINPNEAIQRHMWSTPAFVEISEKKCYRIGVDIKWLEPTKDSIPEGAELLKPYEFVPVSLMINKEGIAEWKESGTENSHIRIFRINDYFLYNESMYKFLLGQYASNK